MTQRRRHHDHASAFTLIEVVVALALGVLLLLAVQGIVVQAYRVGDTLEARAAETARRELPFELLRQDLDSLPSTGGFSLRDEVLSFTTLNAMRSPRVAARHAVRVRFEIDRSDSGRHRLLRREREYGDEAREGPGVALASGLRSAAIEIFDGQVWHKTWPLPTPRAAFALRLRVAWKESEVHERVFRLAPLRWRRHDE